MTIVDGLTPAQLAEARRLLDPDHEPKPPTTAQVACVARVVVLNPTVDEIANDMAQIENGDLRELVMTDYLHCAYDFVLDLYMRFAPSGLSTEEKACIRSKFTQLTVQRLSEVMVYDPDAGYTGPVGDPRLPDGVEVEPVGARHPAGHGRELELTAMTQPASPLLVATRRARSRTVPAPTSCRGRGCRPDRARG